jgi:hypothetical protein
MVESAAQPKSASLSCSGATAVSIHMLIERVCLFHGLQGPSSAWNYMLTVSMTLEGVATESNPVNFRQW